jgi:hypothetical protein
VKGKTGEIVGTGNVTNIDQSMLGRIVDMDQVGGSLGLEETNDAAARDELRDFMESMEGLGCLLYFEADIERSDYYSIELAGRGELNYSKKDLAERGYVVGFTLGDL